MNTTDKHRANMQDTCILHNCAHYYTITNHEQNIIKNNDNIQNNANKHTKKMRDNSMHDHTVPNNIFLHKYWFLY